MSDYVELHAHSYFSLLDGATSPEALVQKASEQGMPALALTDHDAVYGAVRFQAAVRQYGVKPIFGTELTLADGHHLTLLVENEVGWRNLCTLITAARHNAPKGEAVLPIDLLEAHTDGLIAFSGCRRGAIPTAVQQGDRSIAIKVARHYQRLFGDRFYIEMQHHQLPDDVVALLSLVAPATPAHKLLDPFAGEGEFLEVAAKAWNVTPYANELDGDRAAKCIERFGPTQACAAMSSG